MNTYQHILIGLDLSEESQQVLEKAKVLAELIGAKLTVAHVCEPIAFAFGGDAPIDLSSAQQTLETQAKKNLSNLISENGIEGEAVVVVGQAAAELHALAEEKRADLIIVGSHGRHGLALLLGSTANGVLHGANCDVLAVRV